MSRTTIIVGGSFAGIKAAWDLRHLVPDGHRILILSDKPRTTFRASFPRVIFEGVDLESLTMDLAANFDGTGIEFVCDAMIEIDQEHNEVVGQKQRYPFDYLILATGARHAYEVLPGSREFAYSVCDPGRILETRKALLNFKGGEFIAGVGAGYTPCDGPPMEILMDLDHHLREAGIRDQARLHYISDKESLLPPGGPEVWRYLEQHFAKRGIIVHKEVHLVRMDAKTLYFQDGTTMPYDLCVLVPPYRGIPALQTSGLANERGFVPVDWNTMRADESIHRNIYAVGDCIGNPGPKQGHLALMQATIAAEHVAWRVNRRGSVRAYLPEFRCVMDQGGGNGLYLYSQYMSDGDVLEIQFGPEPYQSKIRFEQLFLEKRGDIGELHHQMIK
ncbi:MAG: FAD-dependent oxidoreductase [Verrucomicrobiota bacterium]